MERGDERTQDQKKGNQQIDTSASPVGSVRDAVAFFEERVHAGYSDHVNRVQQISKARSEVDHVTSKLQTMTLELELKETKQNLQRAIDENMVMATCIAILQKELEQTKLELQQLKQKRYITYQSIDGPSEEDWVEKDVEHVEDVTKSELIMNHEKEPEFHTNHLTFANEPSLSNFIAPNGDPALERQPSLRTKKKKPLIGGFFFSE